MNIDYKLNAVIDLEQFIALYQSSTLAERRPAENREVMRAMMNNASVTVSAWQAEQLVGIARTLTDTAYVAYLADLAVSKAFQAQGIGRELIAQTRKALSPDCTLVLLAAPAANDFYPRIGFEHNPRAWVLNPGDTLK